MHAVLFALLGASALSSAHPHASPAAEPAALLSDVDLNLLAPRAYIPTHVACPAGTLVRPASGIAAQEAAYIAVRKPKADAALRSFLTRSSFSSLPSTLPKLGLVTSGGGYRSLLTGAGVRQTFDARDSSSALSGLYQSFTYETGLSGGGWMLSSIAGNNWPTISSLLQSRWLAGFQNGLTFPNGLLFATAYTEITTDVAGKEAAGFETSLVDIYGRLLSYQLLPGTQGGAGVRVSSLAGLSNFTSHAVPFPLITSIGVDTSSGTCLPPANGTQYEFSPFEFGSWDAGVRAFTNVSLLGSSLSGGKPAGNFCVAGFDNLGFVAGTTSDVFPELCQNAPNDTSALAAQLEPLLRQVHEVTNADYYAHYPNPFYAYGASTAVQAMRQLSLVDGGFSDQNDPIWPLLHRALDVLVVSDNSADTSDNYPDGAAIRNTYLQSVAQGTPVKMPVIPDTSVFLAQGLSKRPTFFGCHDKDAVTIVYIPNTNYTYDSGQPTLKIQYSMAETLAMVANGNLVGSYNASSSFGTCVGCAVLAKSNTTLPSACDACFKQLCYN